MLNPFSVKYLMGELASGKGSGLTCFLCIDIDFTNVAPDVASADHRQPVDASEVRIRKELKVY